MRWIPFALLLPLVLLLGVGTWALMGERERRVAALQVEARSWARVVADLLAKEATPTITLSLSPREPNTALFQQFDQARASVDALETLLASPDLATAYTPAGLPLEPLVHHALYRCEPSASRAEAILQACLQHPSPVTTRLAFDVTPHSTRMHQQFAKALLTTDAVAVYEALGPSWSPSEPWRSWRGVSWHAHVADDAIHLTSLPFLKDWIAQQVSLSLPDHLAWEIAWDGKRITPALSERLAESQAAPYQIAIGLAAPIQWQREQRQALWQMMGLLVLATMVTAGALWATWRALHRQTTLAALQSDFIASVSHELRTPVASIGVLAERLESDRSTAAQISQYHHFIARETKRLAALVDNILDFSRIEQGRKDYRREPADMKRLVEETVRLLQPRAEEREITLHIHNTLTDEQACIEVDALAIRQALVNLLDNAIKFSDAIGQVTVMLDHKPEAMILSVKDQGVGIAPAEQAKIFDRFYRVERGLRRETRGAGIGLSVVQHIAQGHGGHVTVQSQPAKGSTFTLHLPYIRP